MYENKRRYLLIILVFALAGLFWFLIASITGGSRENEHIDAGLKVRNIQILMPSPTSHSLRGGAELEAVLSPGISTRICSSSRDHCVSGDKAKIYTGDVIVSPERSSLSFADGAFSMIEHRFTGELQLSPTIIARTLESGESEIFNATVFHILDGKHSGQADINHVVVSAGDRYCSVRQGSYQAEKIGNELTFTNGSGISHCAGLEGEVITLTGPNQSILWHAYEDTDLTDCPINFRLNHQGFCINKRDELDANGSAQVPTIVPNGN